jgi:hypothetical protein
MTRTKAMSKPTRISDPENSCFQRTGIKWKNRSYEEGWWVKEVIVIENKIT